MFSKILQLTVGSCDSSQAEPPPPFLQSSLENLQNSLKSVILTENSCCFVSCSQLVTVYNM